MRNDSLIAIIFLVLASAFVYTLIKSLMSLINSNMPPGSLNAKYLIGLFKWPLVALLVFILFIIFGLPALQ